jgi:hypothetical protein
MKIQNSFSWGAGSAMARALLGLAMISGFSACSLPQRFAEAITHNRPIFSPRTELATAAPTVPTVASKQQQVAIADKTTVKSDKKSNDTRSSLYAWDGDDVPGRVSVTIDLSEQKARIYRGGRNVGWTYVATGKQGHRTPTGTFAIREKVRNKTSNSWGVVVNKSGQTVNRDAKNGRRASRWPVCRSHDALLDARHRRDRHARRHHPQPRQPGLTRLHSPAALYGFEAV